MVGYIRHVWLKISKIIFCAILIVTDEDLLEINRKFSTILINLSPCCKLRKTISTMIPRLSVFNIILIYIYILAGPAKSFRL